MAAKNQPRRGVPVWGVFLLFLGVVFFLQTIGVLPWGLWHTLAGYWPVLLIAVGLAIILRNVNVWLVTLAIAAIFAGTVAFAHRQYQEAPPGELTSVYSLPADGIRSGVVRMKFDASNVTVEALPAGAADFVQVLSTWPNAGELLKTNLSQQSGEQTFTLELGPPPGPNAGTGRWVVRLSSVAPLDITSEANAGNVRLSLDRMLVSALDINSDASNVRVYLPPPAGVVRARIDADVSNVEVVLGSNVEARATVESSLASVDFGARFIREGEFYLTRGFDAAKDRYVFEVQADVGRVQVR